MNTDSDLKRAIDINFNDEWDLYTIEEAIDKIGTLLKEKNTPIVHRKEFDSITQNEGESFKEFKTRLKPCVAECNFICPFDANHNLTVYHMINRIRSGVSDPSLQHELLQKSEAVNTYTNKYIL